MCKGMNRSFFNVILGGFGATDQAVGDKTKEQRPVKSGNADDAAFLMKNALRKLHHLHFHFLQAFVL